MMRLTLVTLALSGTTQAVLHTDETAGLEQVRDLLTEVKNGVVETRAEDARLFDAVAETCSRDQTDLEAEMQSQISDIDVEVGKYDLNTANAAEAQENQATAHANGLQSRGEMEQMVVEQKHDQSQLKLEIEDAKQGMNSVYIALVSIAKHQPASNPVTLSWPEAEATKLEIAQMNGCLTLDEECRDKVASPGASFLQTLDSDFPSAKLVGSTIKAMLLQDGATRGTQDPNHSRDYTSLLGELETIGASMEKSWSTSTTELNTSETMTQSCGQPMAESDYGLGEVFAVSAADLTFGEGEAYCLAMKSLTLLNEQVHEQRSNYDTATENAAAAKGDLVVLQAALNDNFNAYKEMKKNCETEAKIFTHNSKLATEELQALEAVIDVINGGMQKMNDVVSFLQISSDETEIQDPIDLLQFSMHRSHKPATTSDYASIRMRRTLEFLKLRAQEIGTKANPALTMVMLELGNHQPKARDPFAHVKEMIHRLIQTLTKEQAADAKHHYGCEEQMSFLNGEARQAEERASKLVAKMKTTGSHLNEMMLEHSALMAQLYHDKSSLKNTANNRAESKQENKDAMEQAKIAVTTMKQAIKMMKALTIRTGHAQMKLIQTKATPYKGAQQGHANVLNLLEVLLHRFKTQYDTLSEQETQLTQDFYDTTSEMSSVMSRSTTKATTLANDIVSRVKAFQDMRQKLVNQNGVLKDTHAALLALKPTCIQKSHAEKDQETQDTIDALNAALGFLTG